MLKSLLNIEPKLSYVILSYNFAHLLICCIFA